MLGRGYLAEPKREWLRALLLGLRSLPPDPAWSVEEYEVLLPVLPDAVERVLREVLSRATPDPDEGKLLDRIEAALRRTSAVSIPPPDEAQDRLRPQWRQRLGRLLGWETPVSRAGRAANA